MAVLDDVVALRAPLRPPALGGLLSGGDAERAFDLGVLLARVAALAELAEPGPVDALPVAEGVGAAGVADALVRLHAGAAGRALPVGHAVGAGVAGPARLAQALPGLLIGENICRKELRWP